MDLIYGGNGQDGRIMQQILQQASIQYLVYTRLGFHKDQKILKLANGQDPRRVASILSEYNINRIFFFSACSQSNSQRNLYPVSDQCHEEVFNLLLSLLHAIKQTSHPVHVVFSSSSLVFGELKGEISTNTKFAPLNDYARHKIKCEELLNRYSKCLENLRISVVYLFNHESIYRSKSFLSSRLLLAIQNNDVRWLRKQLYGRKKEMKFIDMGYAPQFMMGLKDIYAPNKFNKHLLATGKTIAIDSLFNIGLELLGMSEYDFLKDEPIPWRAKVKKDLAFFNLKEENLLYGKSLIIQLLKDSKDAQG